MSIVRKFLQQSWPDRWLLVEASFALMICALAIAILPFRRLARFSARPPHSAASVAANLEDIVERVRWAILAASRHVPWRAMCFEQALAGQMILRRLGIASTLYYGAAPQPNGLIAHVWLRYGERDILGGEIASQFAILATFPEIK